jgi:hypothetical protein
LRVPIWPYRVPRTKKWPKVCRTLRTKGSAPLLPYLLVVQATSFGGVPIYATIVVGHAVRAHSASLLCWFNWAQGRSPDGVCIVVLDTGSLHGLRAGDDGLDVGYGDPYNVPVIDRGPYVYGRDLDITAAVADQIGLTYAGVGLVTWWVE